MWYPLCCWMFLRSSSAWRSHNPLETVQVNMVNALKFSASARYKGFCDIMQQNRPISVFQSWEMYLQFFVYLMNMLTKPFYCYCFTGRQKRIIHYTLCTLPNSHQYIARKKRRHLAKIFNYYHTISTIQPKSPCGIEDNFQQSNFLLSESSWGTHYSIILSYLCKDALYRM